MCVHVYMQLMLFTYHCAIDDCVCVCVHAADTLYLPSIVFKYSYAIDWGNSAIQTGSTVKVSTIVAPYFYPTSSQNDTISSSGLNGNHRTVKVSYCNDPVSLANRCCDTLTFPIQV